MKKLIGFICGALLIGFVYSALTKGADQPKWTSSAGGTWIQMCSDADYISGTFRCRRVDKTFPIGSLSASYLVFSCGGFVAGGGSCDSDTLSVDVATVDARGKEEYLGDNFSRAIWGQKCPVDDNGNEVCPANSPSLPRLNGNGYDMIDLATVLSDVGIHPVAGMTYHVYVATFPMVSMTVQLAAQAAAGVHASDQFGGRVAGRRGGSPARWWVDP